MVKASSQPQSFVVHCGDTLLYFEHGRLYNRSYLNQVFKKRLEQCPACAHPMELFPGLVLRDGSGGLWTVKLKAEIVPLKESVDERGDVESGTRGHGGRGDDR